MEDCARARSLSVSLSLPPSLCLCLCTSSSLWNSVLKINKLFLYLHWAVFNTIPFCGLRNETRPLAQGLSIIPRDFILIHALLIWLKCIFCTTSTNYFYNQLFPFHVTGRRRTESYQYQLFPLPTIPSLPLLFCFSSPFLRMNSDYLHHKSDLTLQRIQNESPLASERKNKLGKNSLHELLCFPYQKENTRIL